MEIREHEIRQRAFDLWVEAGRPDGEPEQFWLQAEKEIKEHRQSEAAAESGDTPSRDLDEALEDSSPASDPPSQTQP